MNFLTNSRLLQKFESGGKVSSPARCKFTPCSAQWVVEWVFLKAMNLLPCQTCLNEKVFRAILQQTQKHKLKCADTWKKRDPNQWGAFALVGKQEGNSTTELSGKETSQDYCYICSSRGAVLLAIFFFFFSFEVHYYGAPPKNWINHVQGLLNHADGLKNRAHGLINCACTVAHSSETSVGSLDSDMTGVRPAIYVLGAWV